MRKEVLDTQHRSDTVGAAVSLIAGRHPMRITLQLGEDDWHGQTLAEEFVSRSDRTTMS